MGKKKAETAKKLMPAGKVVVKSRTYGVHERAARGSKTPVQINDVLKKNAEKTAAVNGVAKRVHDLLKHCGKAFKEAMLWQEMLRRMRMAASMDTRDLLTALKGMELNGKYPLKRFGYPFVSSVQWDKKDCVVALHGGHLHIKSRDTEYCYELFLLMLGKEAKDDGMMSGMSAWMGKDDKDSKMTFAFAVPKKVAYYVVCLHLMTGKNGTETGTLASRGMQIAEVGEKKKG